MITSQKETTSIQVFFSPINAAFQVLPVVKQCPNFTYSLIPNFIVMKVMLSIVLLFSCSLLINAQTPVAYYPFNGNANDAIGSLNGTVSGAILSTDRFGSASTAFRFDGVDDHIDLSNSTVIRPTAALTISAWFNLENQAGAIAGRQIISCTENAGYQIAYDKALNAFVLYVRRNGNYGFVQTPAAPYLTGWHYMAGTFDGRFTRLYMDGVLVGTDDAGATFPIQYFNGVNTYIGAEASDPIATTVSIDPNYYWQGKIDEVKIYNIALTAPQVLQEFNNNVAPVAHYPFNGNANDAVGTNHGTATGGAALTTDRFGNANSAYNFDGINDKINCNFSTNLTTSFTVSCWFKMTALPSINTLYEIISKRSFCATGFTDFPFGLSVNSSGNITALFSKGDDFVAENILQSGILAINQWHFVTVTYAANNAVFLYINGMQVSTASINYGISTNAQNWTIGSASQENLSGCSFTNSHTNGAIDEVKIYSIALTATQVHQEYTSSNQLQKPGSGNAISFDGSDDKITIADNPNINFAFNQDFTVDCWVKIPSTNQPNTTFNFNSILQKWDNGITPAYPYEIWFTNHTHPTPSFRNKIVVNRYDGVNNPGIFSNVLMNDDKFHHIAFTKRGPVLELFVDGVPQGTTIDNTTGITTNTLPLIIAGAPNGSIPLQGNVDEVRIWSAGMTQTQIRDRMCKKITSTDPLYSNLVAYYNFDESSGTTAFDGTANANNGTLTNTPTRVTSGAAIGNASSHDYVNATKTVSLTHATGENLTITSTSGSPAGIQVYMVEGQPNNLTGASGVGDNNKYFGVFQAGGTAPQYTAVYNYNGNPFVTPAIESQLRLNKRTDNAAGTWSTMTAIPNEPANTISVTGESTEYILGRLGGSLPLNLLSFTGSKQNNDALLQWKTANEINVSRFEVQRSENGIDYVAIGSVAAGGADYSLSDANIFSTKTVLYYRLKSIDKDGRFTVSNIIKLSKQANAELTVYPNPVSDVLTINGLKQKGTILIFNTEGKLLQQQTVSAQTITLDMSKYAKGMYLLQYQSEEEVVNQKIIKQ